MTTCGFIGGADIAFSPSCVQTLTPEHVSEPVASLSAERLKQLKEAEESMIAKDRLIRETHAKRNELEAYIYRTRDEVDSNLEGYITEEVSVLAVQFMLHCMTPW